MRSIAPTLALLVASALLAAFPARTAAGPEAKPSPEPATSSVATAWPAGPPRAPPVVEPPSAPVAPPAPARLTVVPAQAVIEKLGKGDRLALAGDHRNALFAYQDAVYMQPAYAPGRVRLGRAYLALRYPAQAIAQATAVLAADPENADARALLEEASAAASDVAPAPPAPVPASARPAPGPPPAR